MGGLFAWGDAPGALAWASGGAVVVSESPADPEGPFAAEHFYIAHFWRTFGPVGSLGWGGRPRFTGVWMIV